MQLPTQSLARLASGVQVPQAHALLVALERRAISESKRHVMLPLITPQAMLPTAANAQLVTAAAQPLRLPVLLARTQR